MTKTTPTSDADDFDPGLESLMDQRFAVGRQGDAELLARVKARVMRAVDGEAASLMTLRADAGTWTRIAPGIEQKLLSGSAADGASLVRCAPGTELGPHVHPVDEECLVLEGTLRIGEDLLLGPGDFHVARAGSSHPVSRTDTGVLLYLRGALPV